MCDGLTVPAVSGQAGPCHAGGGSLVGRPPSPIQSPSLVLRQTVLSAARDRLWGRGGGSGRGAGGLHEADGKSLSSGAAAWVESCPAVGLCGPGRIVGGAEPQFPRLWNGDNDCARSAGWPGGPAGAEVHKRCWEIVAWLDLSLGKEDPTRSHGALPSSPPCRHPSTQQ